MRAESEKRTADATPVVIPAEQLIEVIAGIFIKAGCSQAEGRRVGENLVDANLTGHDSHGVIRTPRYLRWMREGTLNPGQQASVVAQTESHVVLDGNFGFGQTVGPQAVERGISMARTNGVSIVALRNAGHLGRIGAFAETAAAAGQVSIHFVNVAGSVLVAPFGGTERRMSTAPVAIGVPVEGAEPVILDFATSLVAEGKILIAAKGGKPLPENSLIGPDGKTSGDPALLYGDADPAVTPDQRLGPGAITAMGEHKGSGLALMCELLAGALTGSGATGPHHTHVHNGMLSVYMSIERFAGQDSFTQEVKRYIAYFKSSRPARPDAPVLIPGEPERQMREKRLRDGIPLARDAWAAIVTAGREVGAAIPDIRG